MKKNNITGNNIKDYIYVFVLKQKKMKWNIFKPSSRALKYGKNRRKSTKIDFFKTLKDRR